MSSSEEEDHKHKNKSKSKGKKQDYAIKPEKGGAALDTSSWPLLLKVYIIHNKSYLLIEL
jgi:hypothetical protein